MFASSVRQGVDLALFKENLLADEDVLWTGQPLTRIIFRKSDWFAIPFSLFWGGFALFWEFGVSGGTQHSDQSVLSAASHLSFNFMSLWGIPFILIGQYLIWGRFLYTAWKKTRTFYALTNKRVLVLNTGPSRRLTDAAIVGLTSVALSTRSDGAGTIEFAPEPEVAGFMGSNRRNNGMQMDVNLSRLAFYDIPDVASVYKTIQSLRDRSGYAESTAYRPR